MLYQRDGSVLWAYVAVSLAADLMEMNVLKPEALKRIGVPKYMFHIVLVEPEIPQNTGNIGRLCLATGCQLHLVRPLGFDLSEKALRRAGLDYWQHLKVIEHDNLPSYLKSIDSDTPMAFATTKSEQSLFDFQIQKGMHILFGKETAGLPESLFIEKTEKTFRIPMFDDRVRSLNLANSVGIVMYEGIRQLN